MATRTKKASDVDVVNELSLYAANDYALYQAREPYLKNMKRRIAKGTYDVDKGIKLWTYYAKLVASNYKREHGSPFSQLTTPADITALAEEFERDARAELKEGAA